MANFAEYKDVWVFTEQRQGKLMNVARQLLGEGYRLSREISKDTRVCAVLAGDGVDHLVDELYAYGADVVYQIDHFLLKEYTTDAYAKAMTDAIRTYKPEIVLFGATFIGRDLAPRIAARLDTGLTADCTRLDINTANYVEYLKTYTTASTDGISGRNDDNGLKQTRPAFGGNLMATIVTPNTRPQMATVRPGVMDPREKKQGARGQLIRVCAQLSADDIHVEVVEVVKAAKELVSLTDADIICSGGRGLGSAEGFRLMEEFAAKVGGVVGASRAAVDSGWIDQSHQVGQTGTTVKPKIYFACGISGAIQHQAGMKGSDVIVAVNKDPQAPMMQIADYAICGDLKKVVPEIIAQWDAES
ncbi:electron transfer flavoprotein subunit alpha/FixB family protein [Anaerovorax odorimutans]|uniref:Electron transfer flavoprotein subunit alpha/FixB family protein n=1 Tax=Anaerovorax odorimutans TaxID=109327 RepID=A0ABT1RP75_9FIRM|nr:electron transfer flavoprotein subunit alpha/FixB family protein [Anaerovorax odorimutans]MCQ4636996.1 electron transfer flavoprotein subunit alpha/FixB family protein [Anaerovorax odorimutans]